MDEFLSNLDLSAVSGGVSRGNGFRHIVLEGETVAYIARQFGCTAKDIYEMNSHIAPVRPLVPGMELIIPDKSGR